MPNYKKSIEGKEIIQVHPINKPLGGPGYQQDGDFKQRHGSKASTLRERPRKSSSAFLSLTKRERIDWYNKQYRGLKYDQ